MKNLFRLILFLLLSTVFVTSCGSQGVTSAQKETYLIDITFEGGTGKAYIKSPVEVTDVDGQLTARFVWSSKNYDYMIVGGVKYENENEGGESTFTVDIDSTTGTLPVVGDTVAMSTPHEIEYLITWGEKKENKTETIAGAGTDKDAARSALKKAGLSLTEKTELKYATCFEIEKYGE